MKTTRDILSTKASGDNGLEVHIERAGLHPVTCLTTLTHTQKNELLENDKILASIGLKPLAPSRVLEEAKQVCKTK